jgi:hypothetical protein
MDAKDLKREVRDAWADLRRLRRARAKLVSAEALAQSAALMTAFAAQLTNLADQARAFEDAALPNPEIEGVTTAPLKKTQRPKSGKKRASTTKKKAKKKA